jgi:hypothetical protein
MRHLSVIAAPVQRCGSRFAPGPVNVRVLDQGREHLVPAGKDRPPRRPPRAFDRREHRRRRGAVGLDEGERLEREARVDEAARQVARHQLAHEGLEQRIDDVVASAASTTWQAAER